MNTMLCRKCGEVTDQKAYQTSCPDCGGPLYFDYDDDAYKAERKGGSMWKYRSILPVGPDAKVVSLEEGGTPLVRARFEERAEVWIKNETRNPTGSHKDRSLSVGVTKALELGLPAIVLYSDGSTALSAAAYAARAGLRCVITFGRGASEQRLLPLMVYGARLLEYQGTPDEAVAWVHESCEKLKLYEGSTYRLANPYEAEAPRTIGFEILEQLGGVPDWIVCPAGGGGTLAGIFKAFGELQSRGEIEKMPRMAAVVPKDVPSTIQVKTALAYPPDGVEALRAIKWSDGAVLQVSDAEALAAQAKLGAKDGLYCEPSSAASVAGLVKLVESGKIAKDERAVAIVTGSGFRETATVVGRIPLEKVPVEAVNGIQTLEKAVGR